MAISVSQYIDLLFKKLSGVTKTATAAQKGITNEAIASPPLLRGDIIWMQSAQIPNSAQTVAGLTLGYTGVGALKMSVDTTVPTISGVRPTWLAQNPPGAYVSANQLRDWITPEFGSTWGARFFVDSTSASNPTTTGTEIFAAGISGVGEFYYDNQAGVLNFIGETIPAVLVSNPTYVIYLVGYRYVGLQGVTNVPNNTTIGNLNFNNTTISSTTTNSNIYLAPNGTGNLIINSAVTGNANITAPYFIGNGSQLTNVVAVTAGTVTTNAQPNITSTGTLTSLTVTGNISSGNANLGNLAIANYFTGTLTTSAQPNITSTGTLTSLTISGTTNLGAVGNVTITGGSSGYVLQTNGSGGLSWIAINSAGISNGNSNISIPTSNGNINLTSAGNTIMVVTGSGANINGSLNVTGNTTIGNLTTGGAGGNIFGANNINANTFTGILTTNAQPNITSVGTLTSLTVTGNGAFGNVNAGNLLTANYSTAVITTGAQPNITSVGTLTSLTVSGTSNLGPVGNVTITGGTSGYYLQTNGSGTLTWASVPTGTGISNGTSNVNIPSINGNVNISSAGNANIVVVTSTGANINGYANVSGNVNANNFIAGSGSGGNLSGANNISANTFTGTLTTNAQPNITSVGTLTSLTVSGNANVGNIGSSSGVFTSNITASNIYANSGTIGATLLTGTLTTALQPNITSTGTLTSLIVSGTTNLGAVGNVTITGGSSGYYLQTNGSGGLSWVSINSSSISNGTSNVSISVSNGNVNINSGGNATLVITNTGANIAGTLNVTGNVVAGNITTGGAGGNLSGANNISANTFTGNLTTNAQPNITSVGTLTSLTVSGTSNLGAVGNITITGGSSGYYLQTNGSGGLSWVAINASGISNGTSNISIPVSNGNVNTTANGNTTLVVTGTGANIAGTLNVTGTATVGNLTTSGPSGNIAGANNISANTFTGNLTTAAQPNITSVGTLTSLTISGHLIANTMQMGYNEYAFYSTSVYFATTTSTASNQVLWSAPAAELSSVDFTIISTDTVGATRQTCKISSAILGTAVVFNEYGGLYINGGVGSFSVIYQAGATPMISLVVTPDSSNLTDYNMFISKYLV